MNLFENFFGNAQDDGSDRVKSTTRLTLRAIVGGYIVYMGWQLVSGGESNGEKPVPEWVKIVMGILFITAGIAFIGYALYAFYKAYKASQLTRAELRKEAKSDSQSASEPTAQDTEKMLCNEKYIAVREIYQMYLDAAEKAETEKKPTDGLLGMGSSPKDAPFHDEFYNALSQKLDELSENGLTAEEACLITGYILDMPDEHRNDKPVFPMLYAATGLAEKLADRLNPKDADRLAIKYSENFPKPERMPAQEKTLRALYDRARIG